MHDELETRLHRVLHRHQRMGLYVFGPQQPGERSIPSAGTQPVSMSSSGEAVEKAGQECSTLQVVIAQYGCGMHKGSNFSLHARQDY